MSLIVNVKTPPCMVCGKESILPMGAEETIGIARWQRGELIQNALPGLTADERELLMTGTHPDCWDKMFGE